MPKSKLNTRSKQRHTAKGQKADICPNPNCSCEMLNENRQPPPPKPKLGKFKIPHMEAIRRSFGRVPGSPNEYFYLVDQLTKDASSHSLSSSIETKTETDNSPSQSLTTLSPTTLDLFTAFITDFFNHGIETASILFASILREAPLGKTSFDLRTPGPLNTPADEITQLYARNHPFHSIRVVVTFLLLIASPARAETVESVTRFMMPDADANRVTMRDIEGVKSENLSRRFNDAKRAAVNGKVGRTTLLAVHLVDEHYTRCIDEDLPVYTTFDHAFVLGVERDGWRLFQGFEGDEDGCFRLDQWVMVGGTRKRDWGEAKRWLRGFERLVDEKRHDGPWTEEMNGLFVELFMKEWLGSCEAQKLVDWAGRINPFKPFVRIFELEDLRSENILKYNIPDKNGYIFHPGVKRLQQSSKARAQVATSPFSNANSAFDTVSSSGVTIEYGTKGAELYQAYVQGIIHIPISSAPNNSERFTLHMIFQASTNKRLTQIFGLAFPTHPGKLALMVANYPVEVCAAGVELDVLGNAEVLSMAQMVSDEIKSGHRYLWYEGRYAEWLVRFEICFQDNWPEQLRLEKGKEKERQNQNQELEQKSLKFQFNRLLAEACLGDSTEHVGADPEFHQARAKMARVYALDSEAPDEASDAGVRQNEEDEDEDEDGAGSGEDIIELPDPPAPAPGASLSRMISEKKISDGKEVLQTWEMRALVPDKPDLNELVEATIPVKMWKSSAAEVEAIPDLFHRAERLSDESINGLHVQNFKAQTGPYVVKFQIKSQPAIETTTDAVNNLWDELRDRMLALQRLRSEISGDGDGDDPQPPDVGAGILAWARQRLRQEGFSVHEPEQSPKQNVEGEVKEFVREGAKGDSQDEVKERSKRSSTSQTSLPSSPETNLRSAHYYQPQQKQSKTNIIPTAKQQRRAEKKEAKREKKRQKRQQKTNQKLEEEAASQLRKEARMGITLKPQQRVQESAAEADYEIEHLGDGEPQLSSIEKKPEAAKAKSEGNSAEAEQDQDIEQEQDSQKYTDQSTVGSIEQSSPSGKSNQPTSPANEPPFRDYPPGQELTPSEIAVYNEWARQYDPISAAAADKYKPNLTYTAMLDYRQARCQEYVQNVCAEPVAAEKEWYVNLVDMGPPRFGDEERWKEFREGMDRLKREKEEWEKWKKERLVTYEREHWGLVEKNREHK